jgi:hypothetical protein
VWLLARTGWLQVWHLLYDVLASQKFLCFSKGYLGSIMGIARTGGGGGVEAVPGGRLLVGIAASVPAGGMYVCVVCCYTIK